MAQLNDATQQLAGCRSYELRIKMQSNEAYKLSALCILCRLVSFQIQSVVQFQFSLFSHVDMMQRSLFIYNAATFRRYYLVCYSVHW